MKVFLHLLRFVVIILFICCADCCVCDVYAENSGGFTYTVTDGVAVVTGYEGEPEFIDIPHEIEGCPVAEIGERAFSSCLTLRRVIFPDSLRKIGNYAFYACDSLQSAPLPDSVVSLGEGCFCGCTKLSYMRIPSGLTELPDSCFRACTNLGEVRIPSNIRKIGDFCFSGCTMLSCVSLGENLSETGERAFYMCSSLESVCIPKSLRSIGKEAFGFIPSNMGAAVKAGFTLSGFDSSPADRYAEMSGIRFSASSESTSHLKNGGKTVRLSEFALNFVIISLIVSSLLRKFLLRRRIS